MITNHTGTDKINTHMVNLNDDQHISDWNLEFITTLDNHHETAQGHQPLFEDNDDINMDPENFNVNVIPSPSDNLTKEKTIDDDSDNLQIYRETPQLGQICQFQNSRRRNHLHPKIYTKQIQEIARLKRKAHRRQLKSTTPQFFTNIKAVLQRKKK